VVIDVPKDVTDPNVKVPYEYPRQLSMRSYNPVVKGHQGQIKKAVDIILGARRPMIYSGGGVVLDNASEVFTDFARKLGYPVTNTLMGLGGFPGTDPQFVGMLGMHGTYEANMAMHECDVLVAIGARFDDRVTGTVETFCPDATIVHVDIDPASISKTVRVDVPIVGSVKNVLTALNAIIEQSGRKPNPDFLAAWWTQIDTWRAKGCLRYERGDKIKPQYVVEKLYEITAGEAYVTSDVGQHQMWAAQYYPFDKPRRWINSGGLGTMGFGLPAAIGVQLAHPGEPVVCVTGEASIIMCIQELSTALQYDLPIKVINLNNRYMGMVRQWQEFFYDRRYSHSYMDALPDFVKLAESFGHVGMRVERSDDVEAALREAMDMKERLVFLDIVTDPTENVYPMIKAGKGHHEMELPPHLSPERELA